MGHAWRSPGNEASLWGTLGDRLGTRLVYGLQNSYTSYKGQYMGYILMVLMPL